MVKPPLVAGDNPFGSAKPTCACCSSTNIVVITIQLCDIAKNMCLMVLVCNIYLCFVHADSRVFVLPGGRLGFLEGFSSFIKRKPENLKTQPVCY